MEGLWPPPKSKAMSKRRRASQAKPAQFCGTRIPRHSNGPSRRLPSRKPGTLVRRASVSSVHFLSYSLILRPSASGLFLPNVRQTRVRLELKCQENWQLFGMRRRIPSQRLRFSASIFIFGFRFFGDRFLAATFGTSTVSLALANILTMGMALLWRR